jgi:hypothetical protein
MRRLPRSILAAGCAVLLTATGAEALTEIKVRGTLKGEYQPVAADGYLGWQEFSQVTDRFNAFVKPAGEDPIRLNTGTAQGAMGGIDGQTLAYQQYRPAAGISDIKLFDLVSRTRSDPPPGVNTGQWEYFPSISGPWFLFARIASNGWRRVILRNTATSETRILALANPNQFLAPGQVNGDFAVWEKCAGGDCNVYRHQISTSDTEPVPNPGRFQYAPSVADDGTMYFARHPLFCSERASIVRRPLGGSSSVLGKIKVNRDIGDTYVYTDGTGDNHVHYDRFVLTDNCSSPVTKSDIYKIIDGSVLAGASGAAGDGTGGEPVRYSRAYGSAAGPGR